MENKFITELHYDFVPPIGTGTIEVFPEKLIIAKVGANGCEEIIEHPARGEGDKWYYDIKYEDGRTIRTFNPHTVIFENTPF